MRVIKYVGVLRENISGRENRSAESSKMECASCVCVRSREEAGNTRAEQCQRGNERPDHLRKECELELGHLVTGLLVS